MQGHRKALALTRKTVHERGRGRMEGRGSQPAGDQHDAEHQRRAGKSNRAQHHDAHDGTGEQEETRPPPVGNVSEPQLRYRRRDLKAHRQGTRRREGQIEPRDEQRQQRRVDVRVAVHRKMRGRHQQDGPIEPEDHGSAAQHGTSAAPRPSEARGDRTHDVLDLVEANEPRRGEQDDE